MAELVCPSCQKVNKVAGYVPPPECPKEGKPCPTVIYCGWCGAMFAPGQAVVPPVTPVAALLPGVKDIMEG